MYAYFRDKDGRPLTARGRNGKPRTKDVSGGMLLGDGVIKRFIRNDWRVRGGSVKKEVHMIVTPRVVVSIRVPLNAITKCVSLLTVQMHWTRRKCAYILVATHWKVQSWRTRAKTVLF